MSWRILQSLIFSASLINQFIRRGGLVYAVLLSFLSSPLGVSGRPRSSLVMRRGGGYYTAYGVYADLIIIYPKPYSIYLRGTVNP